MYIDISLNYRFRQQVLELHRNVSFWVMAFKKIWTELNLNPSQVYIKLKNHKVKGIRNGEYTDLLRILFGMLSDIILVWAIYGNQNGSKSVTKFSGENMQLSFNSLSFLKDLFSEGKVLHIFCVFFWKFLPPWPSWSLSCLLISSISMTPEFASMNHRWICFQLSGTANLELNLFDNLFSLGIIVVGFSVATIWRPCPTLHPSHLLSFFSFFVWF